MTRISLLLALLLLTCCLIAAGQETKNYKSQKGGYEFSYPAGWLLESDEQSDYVSLFSPGADKSRPHSFDLVRGIKIEFVHETGAEAFTQELKDDGFAACGTTNDGQRTTYCAEDDGLTLIATGLPHDKIFFSARGYIPEKDKKTEYLAQYLKIIESFTFSAK